MRGDEEVWEVGEGSVGGKGLGVLVIDGLGDGEGKEEVDVEEVIGGEVGIGVRMVVVVLMRNAMKVIEGMEGVGSGVSMVGVVVLGVVLVDLGMWRYGMVGLVRVGVIMGLFW